MCLKLGNPKTFTQKRCPRINKTHPFVPSPKLMRGMLPVFRNPPCCFLFFLLCLQTIHGSIPVRCFEAPTPQLNTWELCAGRNWSFATSFLLGTSKRHPNGHLGFALKCAASVWAPFNKSYRAVGNGIHFCDTTERASQRLFSSYKGGVPCITEVGRNPLIPQPCIAGVPPFPLLPSWSLRQWQFQWTPLVKIATVEGEISDPCEILKKASTKKQQHTHLYSSVENHYSNKV